MLAYWKILLVLFSVAVFFIKQYVFFDYLELALCAIFAVILFLTIGLNIFDSRYLVEQLVQSFFDYYLLYLFYGPLIVVICLLAYEFNHKSKTAKLTKKQQTKHHAGRGRHQRTRHHNTTRRHHVRAGRAP